MASASPLDRLPEDLKRKLRKTRQPSWVSPMLATLTKDPFSDPGWIYERKLDGERCLAFRKGRKVRLLSRGRKDLNGTYPEIVEALGKERREFVADI